MAFDLSTIGVRFKVTSSIPSETIVLRGDCWSLHNYLIV